MFYKYSDNITIIATEYDEYLISHNSQKFNELNQNLIVVKNEDKLSLYLIQNSKIIDTFIIKLTDIYLNLFSLYFQRQIRLFEFPLYKQKLRVKFINSIFVDFNEDTKETKLQFWIIIRDLISNKNTFSILNLKTLKEFRPIYGSHYEIKIFRDKDFLYKTTNLFLGHTFIRYVNYVDENSIIDLKDGLTLIETDNINKIEGKLIRLIRIKNTNEWYLENKEFPQFDLENKNSIKDFEVLGKIPSEKKIEKFSYDFSTGMIIYQ